MVRCLLCFTCLFFLSGTALGSFSADQLRKEAGAAKKNKYSSKRQIKAEDLRNRLGKIKTQKKVFYKMPSGAFVDGYQLPNGSVAPALVSEFGHKQAGCLANDGVIYKAEWRGTYLECYFPQEDIYPIDDIARSVLDDGTILGPNGVPVADENSPDNKDEPQGGKVSKYAKNKPDIDNDVAEKKKPAPKGGKVSKYNKNNTAKSNRSASNRAKPSSSSGYKQQKNATDDSKPWMYRPRGNVVASGTSSVGQIVVKNKKYGINFGTWAKAELQRKVTSADNGEVEILLKETIQGKYASIPAGTTLFGRKAFNASTKRLDITITKGITADGTELNGISATVYSLSKDGSGLRGQIIRDRSGEGKGAAAKGLMAATAAAASKVSGNGIVGTGVKTTTDSLVDTESNYVADVPDAIIQVSPQRLFIRINTSI